MLINNKRNIFYQMFSISLLSIFLFIAGCTSQNSSAEELPLDGETLAEKWRFGSGGAINKVPLRVADVVDFVPSGGTLTAVDAVTGELRWQLDASLGVWERAYTTDGKLEGSRCSS